RHTRSKRDWSSDVCSSDLHAFDVLLISVDRRHEIEVALKLQNLMVINLPEARRLMATASTTTPLVVSHGLAQRKAEAIRRQLQRSEERRVGKECGYGGVGG